MSSVPLVLYQRGSNMFDHQWVDGMGNVAFTISEVPKTPNPLIKLEREPEWAELHQPILGPDKSWLYLGPNNSPGYVCYGTNPIIYGMNDRFRKQKWAGCSSRVFISQRDKEYRWKIASARMECTDSWTTLAIWERSKPEEEYEGKLTLTQAAFPIATEIMTSLVLNKMAADLNWD